MSTLHSALHVYVPKIVKKGQKIDKMSNNPPKIILTSNKTGNNNFVNSALNSKCSVCFALSSALSVSLWSWLVSFLWMGRAVPESWNKNQSYFLVPFWARKRNMNQWHSSYCWHFYAKLMFFWCFFFCKLPHGFRASMLN